ncbi:hypothetical protein ACFOEK_09805 [Litoribrevibacter euphylliae]|uniref:Uncharacterized protein n=1 Tax=Litoribrevibacter euphylliae TaxID=1834034 RepID=A0ABV7HBS0_9GAMM
MNLHKDKIKPSKKAIKPGKGEVTAGKQGMSWPNAVLVAIDQLGNAIAGGNPDATVSARVGFFSIHAKKPYIWYWKALAEIIDFAFYPVDGPNHCVDSYRADKDELYQQGSDFFRAMLGLIVIVFCLPTSLVLRLAVLIYPNWHFSNR